MSSDSKRIAEARLLIQRLIDRQKRLDFKSLEVQIRAVMGQPGASYDDVVQFLAACGLVVKLGSVRQFCVRRDIRPTPRAASGGGPVSVLRRRARS